MKDIYYDQAVACVKDYVLPAQYELYKSCGGQSRQNIRRGYEWKRILLKRIEELLLFYNHFDFVDEREQALEVGTTEHLIHLLR